MKSKIIDIVKIILIIGLAVTVIFLSLIINGFFDGPDTGDPRPRDWGGTLQIYNDGCCFVLTDLDVQLVYEDGTAQRVLYVQQPHYQSKQSTALTPLDIEGNIDVVVGFFFEYENVGHTSFNVMRFNDSAQLKTEGIILTFGDGVLHVKSGSREVGFSDGQSPWVTGLEITDSELIFSPQEEAQSENEISYEYFVGGMRGPCDYSDRPDGQATLAEINALLPPDSQQYSIFELTTKEVWESLGAQVYNVVSDSSGGYGIIVKDRVIVKYIADDLGSWGINHIDVIDMNEDGYNDLVYTYTWGSGMVRTQKNWLDLQTGESHFIEDDMKAIYG